MKSQPLRIAFAVAGFSAVFALVGNVLFSGPVIIIVATVAGATLGLALQRWKFAPSS
jgi:Flp pilus assembly protein TadB